MKKLWVIAVIAAAAAAAVYFLGVRPRQRLDERLERQATVDGKPSVEVTLARKKDLSTDIVLPALLQPLRDTPIHARASGYLAKWLVDIGDSVKAGQPLAIIEAPEIDQQLRQARASLDQARTEMELARVSAKRWRELLALNAVSQQEADQRDADFEVGQANVKAAQAEVDRLAQVQSFQTVRAPFDGVISVRNVDVGTLITAGGDTDLFHITQSDTMRVYLSVPQSEMRSVRDGLPVDVLVPQISGRTFSGTIVRHAGALDPSNRTLLAEVQIPNPKGELLPGTFVQVRLRPEKADLALVVPSDSVVIRADGARVAVVTAENRIQYKKVSIGRDFGSQIEILSGITDGERVVANPSDRLSEDVLVTPDEPGSEEPPRG